MGRNKILENISRVDLKVKFCLVSVDYSSTFVFNSHAIFTVYVQIMLTVLHESYSTQGLFLWWFENSSWDLKAQWIQWWSFFPPPLDLLNHDESEYIAKSLRTFDLNWYHIRNIINMKLGHNGRQGTALITSVLKV